MPQTLAEQAATFTNSTFKDGEPSDGSPTAEEQAATAANAASSEAAKGAGVEEVAGAVVEGAEGEADDEAGEGESAEGAEGAEAAAEPKEGEPPAEAKKAGKKDYNARIGDLTAARRQAERDAAAARQEADAAKAELAALKSGKTPLTAPQSDDKSGAVPPDPSQFDYGELDPKYIAALARHETVQALKAAKAEDDNARQADAAAAQQQEQARKQDDLVKAGVKLHDDFDEVVMQGAKAGTWSLSPTLGELILDSEHGPAIAYELASDPDEAARVFKLSPAQQAAHFGRLEAKIEAAQPSQGSKTLKPPQAPPPPKTPRGNSGSNKVGADSSDFAAVERAYRAGALR